MAGVSTVIAQDPSTSPPLPTDNKPVSADAPATDAPTTNGGKPANSDQKKDRKPRRERLPLPDVIPDVPVKRYPEPSKADLHAAVEAEDAKLQACFDRLNAARAINDERMKIREEFKPAYEAARKVLNERNDQCRALFDTHKGISTKLKNLKEADIAARNASASGANEMVGAGKDGQEALRGLRTINELEERIAEMKYNLETGTMPILEEKKLVARISFLTHKGREFIQGRDKIYRDEKAAKEQRIALRKSLEEERKAQDALIDAAKASLEEQKKVVDGIRREQDAKMQKLQESAAEIDRDAEKKKIGEIKAVIRNLREDYQVELDKWYLNERIHIEQQKIARRKKYEAAQAEREARRKAWEAEQAQYPEPDPYQRQKDMCAGLTVYMQTLLGETVDKPTVNLAPEKANVSLKTTSNTREISASGKAIGKSTSNTTSGFENLAFSDFVKKSGGKSRNKKNRRSVATNQDSGADTDTPLKPHSIDYIAAFTELEIKPPNKISEVRAALEAVKAKKAYYDSKPKPTEEEKAEMEANKTKKNAATVSEKKEKSIKVDIMNGDEGPTAFPDLLGGDSSGSGTVTQPARDITGPSFKAVASGTASAPPPTPAMSSADISSLSNVGARSLDVEGAIDSVAAIVADENVGEVVAAPEAPLTEA